jgi:hypothetical protein
VNGLDAPEEDDAFCSVAVDLGFLDPEQAAAALEAQRVLARPQRVGMLLEARRLLTRSQVEEVLRVQAQRRGRPSEDEDERLVREAARVQLFGKLVVLRGLATEGEVEECIFLQRKLADSGERLRIGEVLVRKGYLTVQDVLSLIDLQKRAETIEVDDDAASAGADRV